MKRYILVLMIILLTFTLASCSKNYVTKTEIEDIVLDLLPEEQVRTTYDLESFQDDILDMVESKRDGVVGVIAEKNDINGSGSGVIYKKVGNMYYVVTNYHVIQNYTSLQIITKEGELNYHVSVDYVGADVTTDLAVLKFETDLDLPVISFANSYETRVGEIVFAIGNPSSVEYFGSVTMGVIGGDMKFFTDGYPGGFDSALLQHDAAISQGNSGGALLDINGDLIGINNMQLLSGYVGTINFAIPSNTVQRIIVDLEDDGFVSLPNIGVTIAIESLCTYADGVCVLVASESNAADAGMQDLDEIVGYKISGMDDFLEIHTEDQLLELMQNSSVGDTIQIKYIRNDIEYTSLEVVLDERP